jgi:hypothetical protein
MNLLDFQNNIIDDIYAKKSSVMPEIYALNTKTALKNQLESVYPVCQKIVGNKFFYKACDEYIHKNCLKSYDLTFYGQTFSEHLNKIILNLELSIRDKIKYLPDLAKWEWGIHFAQCGPNNHNFFKYPEDLLNINLDDKEIISPKNSTLIYSNYGIEAIWQAHESDWIKNQDFELQINLGAYYWFIGLVNNQLEIQTLTQSEFQILTKIKSVGISECHMEPDLNNNLVDSLHKGRLILV